MSDVCHDIAIEKKGIEENNMWKSKFGKTFIASVVIGTTMFGYAVIMMTRKLLVTIIMMAYMQVSTQDI